MGHINKSEHNSNHADNPETSKKTTISCRRIPSDTIIMEEILPRLPVRSLIRFKTACKTWFSTISSSEFAKTHLQFSSLSPNFLLKIEGININYIHELYLLPYDELNNNLKGFYKLQNQEKFIQQIIHVVGSSNGLLCLYIREKRWFSLWNPATHQYEGIKRCEHQYTPYYHRPHVSGFGYVPSIDDYKLLTVDYNQFFIFSLRSWSWKQLHNSSTQSYNELNHTLLSVTSRTEVCIDGTLYWSLEKPWHNPNGVVRVLEFDLGIEELREVPGTSDWLTTNGYSKVDEIFKIQGCLSLCCYNDNLRHDVWRLNEMDDPTSWQILYRLHADLWVSILGFLDSGKFLAHQFNRFKIVDTDQEGDSGYLEVRFTDYMYVFYGRALQYVESLVDFRLDKDK